MKRLMVGKMDKAPLRGIYARGVRCVGVLAGALAMSSPSICGAHTILTLGGHGTHTTASFEVLDRWQVNWTAHEEGVLVLIVPDNTQASMAARVSLVPTVKSSRGFTYIEKGGRYSLRIVSSGEWVVTVQQLP